MTEISSGATLEPQTSADGAQEPKRTLDITEIMAILPHRYPFLLIDRVVEMERKQRIVAIKNVTANEPQFTGHFPDFPIMPGVMTIEAMAQAGGALLLTEVPDRDSKLMVFTGIDKAVFRQTDCARRPVAHRGDGAELAVARGEDAGRVHGGRSRCRRGDDYMHAGAAAEEERRCCERVFEQQRRNDR